MSPNVSQNAGHDGIEVKTPVPTSTATTRRVPTSPSITSLKETKWNTKELPWRIASDVTSAACASGLVAPLVTIIDRAIIENASSRSTLRTSILSSFRALFTRPHTFLLSRPFALISGLYFSTYLTANTIDTLSSTFSNTPPETTTAGTPKFLATSAVNMSLCLYKDQHFARYFGAPSAAIGGKVPKASYALFALRDSMTIFASFNLPPLIAPLVPLSEAAEQHISKASAAQFLAPAGIQIFSTPLHLLGLDLYNRPRVGMNERVKRVMRDWSGSAVARMGRIIPAYGVGGVVNGRVRRGLLGWGRKEM